jgi:integrase/recombinase XerC
MDLLTPFLEYLKFEKRASAHTIISYETDLKQFFEFQKELFSIENIEDIELTHIRNWIFNLIEKEKNGSKTVNRKISSLKAIFKYYLKEGKIKENPTLQISSPKIPKRVPQYIEEGDMKNLFQSDLFENSFEGKRDQAILELFYATGIRVSELIQITFADIDLYDCTVKVLGKRNKERIIPFGKTAKETLENYFSLFEHQFHEMNKNCCIFVTSKNNKLSPKSVYKIVRRYLDMITTIDKRSPHIIRHTFATHLLNHGADINAIKEILGHSSLAATQIYTHNSIEKLKSIYQQAHPRA